MKRRSFLKSTAIIAGTTVTAMPAFGNSRQVETERNFLEWRIYHISRSPNAKNLLEQYFKDALKPFLKTRNVKFAAFTEYSMDEPVKLYTLLSFPNSTSYFNVQHDYLKDTAYLKASESFNKIAASAAVYTRYETFLMESFEGFPILEIPGEKKGLFELRLYESASDDAGRRKIAMFDKEEIPLFLKVGLQPVFFGKIVAGQYMPALLYMVGFKDMADRDAAWGRFGESEEWKVMREKPEYADTVSNIQRTFLLPTDYSEI